MFLRICRFGGTILPTRFMVKTYWAMRCSWRERRRRGGLEEATARGSRRPIAYCRLGAAAPGTSGRSPPARGSRDGARGRAGRGSAGREVRRRCERRQSAASAARRCCAAASASPSRAWQAAMHGTARRRIGALTHFTASIASLVAARDEVGAREVAPEALGVVGIEAHRLQDPVDALFGLAEPGQDLALLHDDQVVVRIQAQRALLVVQRLVEVLVHQVHRGQDAVHVAVVVVERQRRARVRRRSPARAPCGSRTSCRPSVWPSTQAFQACACA